MPLGGGKEAFALAVAMTLALSAACGGEPTRGEGAPAGAGGGSGGSSAGVAGSTAGAGGAIVVIAASGGEGGVVDPGCPVCPDASYGVVIHGDGDDLQLEHNPTDGEPSACSADVLYGSRGSCGSGISFAACEDASGSDPCVTIVRSMATYTDRDGTLWSGSVVSVMHDSAPALTNSGTMILALTAGDRTLELSVDFTFCASEPFVHVVCR
jgi:hypothetical protein